MFGSKNGKDSKGRKAPVLSTGLQPNNSLVEGTRVEGNIHTEGDIRIDGKFIGTLKCKGRVIVGPTGHIEGDIHCSNAVVEGHIAGNLFVEELLQVQESATVEGEISTRKLIVQAGSIFNVNCRMGGQKVKDLKAQEPRPIELQKLGKVSPQ